MSVAADHLGHGFDDGLILDDVTFAVSSGEILAIIGPSGVGKTTLLRLLALFDRPRAGTVAIDGEDAWADGANRLQLRRRISFVFQQTSLFDASVARNVEYGLHVRSSWPDRIRRMVPGSLGATNGRQRAIDSLEIVDLADRADSPASDLSGGEAQRAAFARALAIDPSIMLLDEPTSDLDPRNTDQIEQAVLAARDRDIAVVLATHDMHQARRIADRTAVLIGGELIEIDRTDTVFSNPSDSRARAFIEGELVY